LLTSDGEFWKRQRRLAQPAFHKKRIEDYSRIMVETAHEIVSQWRGRSDMDLHAEMMHLTLEIVARSLFGEQIGPNRTKEVGKILELLLKRFMSYVSLTYTFFDWFPRPGKIRYRNALQRLDTIVMEMIAHHRTMLKRGEKDPTLLGTYLRAVDDEGQSMTDRQLRDEVVTLFLAGHETTASALTFTLYLLWQHPQKRGALEAEVREVLNGRLPTINDIENLPYTSNVLKEGMRLYPPAWRVGREATEDLNFDGWTIPAEAQILASQWTMHRDPHYFENPDSFHPERWSDGSLDSMPRYAYFPFGGGPRLCIGARFAETEAILILAIIAQRYRLDCKSLLRLELLPSITLRPKHPVNVKIQTIPVA
jgi:cytochrome P450